tara:strand:+ start:5582 stop:7549 length:1968 start_codon:yes stop_codon:yes gene_type:complete
MALTLVTSDLIGGLDYSKLTGTVPTWNQNTTGSAATLTTARNIGGVSFNGSAAINLPGVNAAGNQNTSGTAAGLSATLAVGSGGTGVTSITALKNVLDDETWTFANNITVTGTLTVNGTGNSAFNGDLYIVEKKLNISTPSGGNAYVKFSDTNSSAKNWRVGTSLSSRGVFNIYNETDDLLAFNILANGNVGIGTTSPDQKLHVSGTIHQSDGTADTYFGLGSDNDNYISTNGGFTRFRNGGTTLLNISSVGLATFKSSYIAANQYGGELTVGGSSTDFGIAMKYDQGGATSGTIYCSPGYTNSGTTLKLGTGSNTNQLVLKGDGNVGIGTTSPDQLLDIKGTNAHNKIKSYFSGTYISGFTFSDGNGGIWYDAENDDLFLNAGHANSQMVFNAGGSEKMRILANGNVGIGINSPIDKLHVVSHIRSSNSSDASKFTQFTTDGVYVQGAQNAYLYSAQNITFYGGGAVKMTLATGGNLALGATSNDAKFFVYGNNHGGTGNYLGYFYNDGNGQDRYGVRINGGANDGSGTTYYIRCDDGDATEVGGLRNNSGTFQIYDASDSSLKENIEDTDIKGLDRINALKVRKFNWKKNGILNVAGFVAQEVENAIPEASSPMDSGLLSVSVTSMIPTLVKAIQEQQAQIELLKQEVESLKQ